MLQIEHLEAKTNPNSRNSLIPMKILNQLLRHFYSFKIILIPNRKIIPLKPVKTFFPPREYPHR